MDKIASKDQLQKPHKFKHSDTKIWMRSTILIIFASIFGLSLYHDIMAKIFFMSWGLGIFVPLLGVGFWMSRLVPMQVHSVFEVVTISFDRIYFGLILLLVALKDISGNLLKINIAADIIMCVILGLMVGRLSGIYFRVSNLKNTEFLRQ